MAPGPLLENYSSLVDTFLEFLTVAVHLILYERDIYPQRSFLKARKYNYPVRQNRHPAVCKFIDDAVIAVKEQLMKCTVSSVSVILISPSQIPLERYVFSTASFPIVGPKEQYIPFMLEPKELENNLEAAKASTSRLPRSYTHVADLHAQYTAVLSRLGSLSSALKALPPDSSFTIAIELRETPRGEPPIGWPMPFVPAEPGLQRKNADQDEAVVWTVARLDEENSDIAPTQETSSGLWSSSGDMDSEKGNAKGKDKGSKAKASHDTERSRRRGEHLGGMMIVPIRNVEAGPFMMEVWIEQNGTESNVSESEEKTTSVDNE